MLWCNASRLSLAATAVTEHLKAATKEHLKTGHLDSGKSVSNRSSQRIKTIEI